MAVVRATNLQQVFDQSEMPQMLQTFIREDLKLTSIADLVRRKPFAHQEAG